MNQTAAPTDYFTSLRKKNSVTGRELMTFIDEQAGAGRIVGPEKTKARTAVKAVLKAYLGDGWDHEDLTSHNMGLIERAPLPVGNKSQRPYRMRFRQVIDLFNSVNPGILRGQWRTPSTGRPLGARTAKSTASPTPTASSVSRFTPRAAGAESTARSPLHERLMRTHRLTTDHVWLLRHLGSRQTAMISPSPAQSPKGRAFLAALTDLHDRGFVMSLRPESRSCTNGNEQTGRAELLLTEHGLEVALDVQRMCAEAEPQHLPVGWHEGASAWQGASIAL